VLFCHFLKGLPWRRRGRVKDNDLVVVGIFIRRCDSTSIEFLPLTKAKRLKRMREVAR
jgi:hypothetical protein